MKGSSTAIKTIQGRGHQALIFLASHADIYMADVVLFNIVYTVQEHHPQAFNDLYLGVHNNDSLFD